MSRLLKGFGLVVSALACLAGSTVARAQQDYIDEHPTKRLALVIGNSSYVHQAHIPSSATDAQGAAKTLRALGFAVTEACDVRKSNDFWNQHFPPFVSNI